MWGASAVLAGEEEEDEGGNMALMSWGGRDMGDRGRREVPMEDEGDEDEEYPAPGPDSLILRIRYVLLLFIVQECLEYIVICLF